MKMAVIITIIIHVVFVIMPFMAAQSLQVTCYYSMFLTLESLPFIDEDLQEA